MKNIIEMTRAELEYEAKKRYQVYKEEKLISIQESRRLIKKGGKKQKNRYYHG